MRVTCDVYNNTAYNNYESFATFGGSGTTVYEKNNIAQGDTIGYGGSGTEGAGSTDNISDHSDAPGTNAKNSVTLEFVSTSTRNLLLTPFNPYVIHQGANLSADPNYSFNYDVAGDSRPSSTAAWDIGADEYSGATYTYASPTITSFIMPMNASSVIVPVSSFTVTSTANPAVAYLIAESSVAPSSTNPGWLLSVPSSFTFGGSGTRTAYAYTMDAYGDVSPSASTTVMITPSSMPVSSSS